MSNSDGIGLDVYSMDVPQLDQASYECLQKALFKDLARAKSKWSFAKGAVFGAAIAGFAIFLLEIFSVSSEVLIWMDYGGETLMFEPRLPYIIILSFLSAWAALCLCGTIQRRWVLKALYRRYAEANGGTILTVGDQGIRLDYERGRYTYQWASVTSFSSAPNGWLLILNGLSGLIIPHETIAASSDGPAMLDYIKAHIGQPA